MKVLVGTLYCGEGDYDRCCESVKTQSVPCEQFTISGLRETEAHRKLYETFKASDADYWLKLDADMVLKNNYVVETMMGECSETTMCVTAMVDDYFSAQPIFGMHLYTRKMDWKWSEFDVETARPDQMDVLSDVPRDQRAAQGLVSLINDPLALHCYYANELQSFHCGYHRAYKHDRICDLILYNARRSGSRAMKFAALGVKAGWHQPDIRACSYGPELMSIFNKYKRRIRGRHA
jgi:hypothetical protein